MALLILELRQEQQERLKTIGLDLVETQEEQESVPNKQFYQFGQLIARSLKIMDKFLAIGRPQKRHDSKF